MEKISCAGYVISLFGKDDGDVRHQTHTAQTDYCSAKQVHGTEIYPIMQPLFGEQDQQADALIGPTTVSLGTYMADCVPIAILGKKYFAVVHGSWKTLHASIIQKTVKKLCRQGEDVVDMYVYIGPCIRNRVYEVGDEFIDLFSSSCLERREGKLYLDLIAVSTSALCSVGIHENHLDIHPDCTRTQHEKRYSRRKEKTKKRNYMGVARYCG